MSDKKCPWCKSDLMPTGDVCVNPQCTWDLDHFDLNGHPKYLDESMKVAHEKNYGPDVVSMLRIHTQALAVHSRTMAAHCECLAMNAENMWAAIMNETPKYGEDAYHKLMVKWGLINKKGEPLI